MNRFWNEKIWTAVTGTGSTSVFLNEWFGKSQLFIKAATATAGTFRIQISPNKTDWFTPSTASFVLVWTETGDALKCIYALDTSTPYVRVIWDTLSAWSIDVWISFTENN